MQSGMYILGKLKGYQESPWSNPQSGKAGINRKLGIITSSYEDEWGETKESVQAIDIPEVSSSEIKQQAEKLTGKTVLVRVVFRARKGGRDGAWLSCFMPQDEKLVPAEVAIQNFEKEPPVKAVNQ